MGNQQLSVSQCVSSSGLLAPSCGHSRGFILCPRVHRRFWFHITHCAFEFPLNTAVTLRYLPMTQRPACPGCHLPSRPARRVGQSAKLSSDGLQRLEDLQELASRSSSRAGLAQATHKS